MGGNRETLCYFCALYSRPKLPNVPVLIGIRRLGGLGGLEAQKHSNLELKIQNYLQCPMPNAQCPIPHSIADAFLQESVRAFEGERNWGADNARQLFLEYWDAIAG
ncbi:MAG: hypothetical protein F6J93_33985 [Oscillatoria sp. SIO1A7]|nr:hypothetical protein [Oscillatoria sp. SIO1A7]